MAKIRTEQLDGSQSFTSLAVSLGIASGSGSTNIKWKKITGTTATVGNSSSTATGIDSANVLCFCILVDSTDAALMPRVYTPTAGGLWSYTAYIAGFPLHQLVIAIDAAATRVASQPFKCVVFYE